jgi:hypothetical protein
MRRFVCLAELTELDKLVRLSSDATILQGQKNHDLLIQRAEIIRRYESGGAELTQEIID